ncbi:MAG: hypothetical protein Q7R52_05155 [archaeon]|nr:hypothetical protein [archaeon]
MDMRNLGEIFDRMFYWEIGRKEITMSGKRVGDEYDIHVVKVEGSGIVPYKIYSLAVEKSEKNLRKILNKSSEGNLIESVSKIDFKVTDVFGLLRLLNKIGIVKYEKFDIKF